MSTSVDTNVLPFPVNAAPQGVRAVAKTRQNGKDSQTVFAGVLKDTSAAQADDGGAETVQIGAELATLSSALQGSVFALFGGQSFLTKAGKDNQTLSGQSGDKQATVNVSANTDLLMAALLAMPLPTTQTVVDNPSVLRSAQAVTLLQETGGSAGNMAGASLLQVQMPVQAATTSLSTATSVLPTLSSTAVVDTTAKILPVQSGDGNIRQTAQRGAVPDFLAAAVLPGQDRQQTDTAAADRLGASISTGQPASSLPGNAVMQELNIRQISVTGKANSGTSLKEKAAVSSTALANREADGTVVVGKSSMTTASYVGTDAQAGLDLAAFTEPNQTKLKAAPGDEAVVVDSFAAVAGQQAEKSNLTPAINQAIVQHLPDPHNVLGQVVEQSNFAKPSYDAGNTEMVIKLKPESLGELTLKVAVDNGVVSASFHSDNPEVRGVLQSSLQQLRQELIDRGLQVDNVGVYAGLTDFSSSGQQEAFRQQQQQSAALNHTGTSDEFIAAVEGVPALNNTAVDDGVDYRV